MRKKIEIEKGTKWGRCLFVKDADPKNKVRMVTIKCDCGTIKDINLDSLKRGITNSCGCLHKELKGKPNLKNQKQDGDWNTPTYRTHYAMMYRCYKPNHKQYKDYGGRGIEVYKEWHNYKGFKKYLIESGLGLRPSVEYSIDRIDNNKGYVPNNIRWSTYSEQAKNKRTIDKI
jgi:hypothetical protein